jgi:hypothetical protein
MRPLPGVVVDTSAGLTIRLSSRAVVRVPEQKKLRLGDTCYVLYNYTTMAVRGVWTEEEYSAEDDIDSEEPRVKLPPSWSDPHEWAVEPVA